MPSTGGSAEVEHPRTPFTEGDMRLDFVGVDPDNPADQCPAVFVDTETGDFYMQGETVTDPGTLAWINSDSRILPGSCGGVVLVRCRMTRRRWRSCCATWFRQRPLGISRI